MTKRFIVPSNFRDVRQKIRLSDSSENGDKVFDTFAEAKTWIVDVLNADISRWEEQRNHAFTYQEDKYACRMRDRSRRALKVVLLMEMNVILSKKS